MQTSTTVLSTIVVPVCASADEFGGSVWLPGQYASFAAEPATPGVSLELVGYTGWANQTSDSLTRVREAGAGSAALSRRDRVDRLVRQFGRRGRAGPGPGRPAEFAAQNRAQGVNSWLTVSFSPAR
jgi:hypothetical protein